MWVCESCGLYAQRGWETDEHGHRHCIPIRCDACSGLVIRDRRAVPREPTSVAVSDLPGDPEDLGGG